MPKTGGAFVTWQDLAVGEIITLYSRSYYVNGADPFTRKFYAERGVQARAGGRAPPARRPPRARRARHASGRAASPPRCAP